LSTTTTPLHQFYHWESKTPDNNFFKQPFNGQWYNLTYRDAGNEIRRVASAIKALNLPPSSNIAILSKNCAQWIMADLAIMMSGHVTVPIYPTLSAEGVKYILAHSEAKAIFIGKLDNFISQRDGVPQNIHRFSFPLYNENEGTSWDDLLKSPPINDNPLPEANQTAAILYSSGTTGTPKGVELSFGAFDFVGRSVLRDLGLQSPQQFISYLPLSHIAEKAYLGMGALYSGSSIAFIESLEKFGENLGEIKPTVFGGVPRIFAKFQEGILSKMPQKKLDLLLSIPIVSGIVKKAIRKKLGFSRIKLIVGGAAPIPVELMKWFARLGIIIREIYGMTENCGYSHGDHGPTPHLGTVGRAWPGIETRISEEGEILSKHPGLMKGYFKDAEETAKSFTADGFLKTGDRGTIDSEGFLTITGRIKDQFKTDKAKFIAPTPIEMKLISNKDIEQVCVVGTGIPQPIALIVLSFSAKSKSQNEINESLSKSLQEINPSLEHYERLQKAVVIKGDWTIENGLMTPSMKLKRNEIEKIYLPNYPLWYREKDLVVWT
jgi:long-chain acyl-CoA synthetase